MEKTLTETYAQQKKRHQDEISSVEGLFWAFSNSQLGEGLNKLNATTKDIVSIGAGGFILRTELQAFKDLLAKHGLERKELKKDIKKLFDALVYELRNHEYCVTYNPTDALDSLGLTKEDIDPILLKKACKESLIGCTC
jgi:hypothetical protein